MRRLITMLIDDNGGYTDVDIFGPDGEVIGQGTAFVGVEYAVEKALRAAGIIKPEEDEL